MSNKLPTPEELENFDSQRFNEDSDRSTFVDTTDAYANMGMKLTFTYVPTGKTVSFKAYITAFNETYSCDWAQEPVFGRIDPISMFKQTTRNVTLGFKVVAGDPSEGFDNLYRLDVLRSFLYPTYDGSSMNALTLAQSPLVRIKVMNLLTNAKQSNTYFQMFQSQLMNRMDGALTTIKNLNVNHNIENPAVGVFEPGKGSGGRSNVGSLRSYGAEVIQDIAGTQQEASSEEDPSEYSINTSEQVEDLTGTKGILPKMIEISMDFMVIHEKFMGHRTSWEGSSGNPEGVYGLNFQASMDDGIAAEEAAEFDEAIAREMELLAEIPREEQLPTEDDGPRLLTSVPVPSESGYEQAQSSGMIAQLGSLLSTGRPRMSSAEEYPMLDRYYRDMHTELGAHMATGLTGDDFNYSGHRQGYEDWRDRQSFFDMVLTNSDYQNREDQ